MNSSTFSILLSLLLLFSCATFAQSSKDFDKNRAKLKRRIKYTNQLLKDADKSAKQSLLKLKLLNKKIHNREALVNSLNKEVRVINGSIDRNNDSILYLKKHLDGLLSEYEKMILYAGKNRTSSDKMMFILSANSFNQAYRRLIYLQQYVNYRKHQIELIQKTRKRLKQQTVMLLAERERKNNLIAVRKQENEILIGERNQHARLYKKLKSKISVLKDDIKKQKKVSKALERSVKEAIRASAKAVKPDIEITKNDDITHKTHEKRARLIEKKGKLSWPVEKGLVLNYFGEQPHSFLKGVKVFNNGIDIGTSENAYAKAVFDGTVSKVVSIPGSNKAVLLNHGEYYSLYANLKEVDVVVGEAIKENQKLGQIYTDTKDNITLLQFQMWHLSDKLDPLLWLKNN